MSILRLEVSNPTYARENTQTVTVHSSHLGRRENITIYNAQSNSKNVPVIILLHGVYGDHWVWMDLGGVHQVYNTLRQQGLSEFILVMPSDGGIWDGSGYLPLKQENAEQWIIEDVIAAVTQTIDAISPSSSIYLSGLSMGGYGALRLGAKYPERFKGISAHSSITKIEDLRHFVETPLSEYTCNNEHEGDIMHWLNLNKEVLPLLRLDCGKEDILFKSNIEFAKQLTSYGIAHQFEELSGSHEWSYWHKNIRKTFMFFNHIEKINTFTKT